MFFRETLSIQTVMLLFYTYVFIFCKIVVLLLHLVLHKIKLILLWPAGICSHFFCCFVDFYKSSNVLKKAFKFTVTSLNSLIQYILCIHLSSNEYTYKEHSTNISRPCFSVIL